MNSPIKYLPLEKKNKVYHKYQTPGYNQIYIGGKLEKSNVINQRKDWKNKSIIIDLVQTFLEENNGQIIY